MPKYEISEQARADLTDVFEYIADDNEHAALQLIIRLLDLFGNLAEHPLMGKSRDELQQGLRSVPLGHYIAFYRIWAGRVVIVRVVHAARDLDEIFS